MLPELDGVGGEAEAAQCGGSGTSPSAKRSSASATRLSSSSREPSTELCGEAHAPIRLPGARAAKYAADSSSDARATVPSMRTCRPSGCHRKTSAARGFSASSPPLRLS